MATRRCASCQQEKTIRGVWYLTPAASHASPFLCETCFRGDALAGSALRGA